MNHFWIPYFVTLAILAIVCSSPITPRFGRSLCPPGTHVKQMTSSVLFNAACRPCTKGTFSEASTDSTSCTKCSTCPRGTYVDKPCTTYSDTVCSLCSITPSERSNYYLLSCENSGPKLARVDLHDLMISNGHKDSKHTSGGLKNSSLGSRNHIISEKDEQDEANYGKHRPTETNFSAYVVDNKNNSRVNRVYKVENSETDFDVGKDLKNMPNEFNKEKEGKDIADVRNTNKIQKTKAASKTHDNIKPIDVKKRETDEDITEEYGPANIDSDNANTKYGIEPEEKRGEADNDKMEGNHGSGRAHDVLINYSTTPDNSDYFDAHRENGGKYLNLRYTESTDKMLSNQPSLMADIMGEGGLLYTRFGFVDNKVSPVSNLEDNTDSNVDKDRNANITNATDDYIKQTNSPVNSNVWPETNHLEESFPFQNENNSHLMAAQFYERVEEERLRDDKTTFNEEESGREDNATSKTASINNKKSELTQRNVTNHQDNRLDYAETDLPSTETSHGKLANEQSRELSQNPKVGLTNGGHDEDDVRKDGVPTVGQAIKSKGNDEDSQSKRRAAIILGVSVGGVAFFTLIFLATRCWKLNGGFKEMKKVNNPETTVQLRSINRSEKYYNDEPSVQPINRLNRSVPDEGVVHSDNNKKIEKTPAFETSTTMTSLLTMTPANKNLPETESPQAHEPLLSALDKLKYIDDSTDDEYVNVQSALLQGYRLSNVAEETASTSPSLNQ